MPVTRSQATRRTRIPLAGGGQETLLSEIGSQYLLPLFSTTEACALRLVCREFLAAVSEQPWVDGETVIQGSIAAWRACFPRALSANVRMRDYDDVGELLAPLRAAPVVDADMVHFEGLRELCMTGCGSITDAAFVHLRGIRALRMGYCSQAGITDAAFVHLSGIHTLDLTMCGQASITDAAFAHLRGIHTLLMVQCRQAGITDAALCAPSWHSHVEHVGLRPGGYHRRRLYAPSRHPHAGHGLLQPGRHHGRSLCAPARHSLAED
jgi:hypothetical protein